MTRRLPGRGHVRLVWINRVYTAPFLSLELAGGITRCFAKPAADRASSVFWEPRIIEPSCERSQKYRRIWTRNWNQGHNIICHDLCYLELWIMPKMIFFTLIWMKRFRPSDIQQILISSEKEYGSGFDVGDGDSSIDSQHLKKSRIISKNLEEFERGIWRWGRWDRRRWRWFIYVLRVSNNPEQSRRISKIKKILKGEYGGGAGGIDVGDGSNHL